MRQPRPGRTKGQKAPRRIDRSDWETPEQRCENCRYWIEAPQEFDVVTGKFMQPDEYKRCQMLAVLTEREAAPGHEKGFVLAIEDVPTLDDKARWMLLPCGPRFTCSRWMTNGTTVEVPIADAVTEDAARPAQLGLFEETPTYAA